MDAEGQMPEQDVPIKPGKGRRTIVAKGNGGEEVARLKHELAEAHEKIQQLRRYIDELETYLAERK